MRPPKVAFVLWLDRREGYAGTDKSELEDEFQCEPRKTHRYVLAPAPKRKARKAKR